MMSYNFYFGYYSIVNQRILVEALLEPLDTGHL